MESFGLKDCIFCEDVKHLN